MKNKREGEQSIERECIDPEKNLRRSSFYALNKKAVHSNTPHTEMEFKIMLDKLNESRNSEHMNVLGNVSQNNWMPLKPIIKHSLDLSKKLNAVEESKIMGNQEVWRSGSGIEEIKKVGFSSPLYSTNLFHNSGNREFGEVEVPCSRVYLDPNDLEHNEHRRSFKKIYREFKEDPTSYCLSDRSCQSDTDNDRDYDSHYFTEQEFTIPEDEDSSHNKTRDFRTPRFNRKGGFKRRVRRVLTRKGRPIARWAEDKAKLERIILHQNKHIREDDIFGPLSTDVIDLPKIFGVNKGRYKTANRGSSANWKNEWFTPIELTKFHQYYIEKYSSTPKHNNHYSTIPEGGYISMGDIPSPLGVRVLSQNLEHKFAQTDLDSGNVQKYEDLYYDDEWEDVDPNFFD